MRVRVKFLNVYSGLIGKKSAQLSFDRPVSLRELLEEVVRGAPVRFKEFVLDGQGEFKSHVWIYVARKRVFDFDMRLTGGEEVVFSLPLVGG
jgi:hypothetical protein